MKPLYILGIAWVIVIGILSIEFQKRRLPKPETSKAQEIQRTNAKLEVIELTNKTLLPPLVIVGDKTRTNSYYKSAKIYTWEEYESIKAKDNVLLFDAKVTRLYEANPGRSTNYILAFYNAYSQALSEHYMEVLYTNANQFGK